MRPSSFASGAVPSVPPCIALTGGIGSGKSAALAMFAERGAAVLSADTVVHALYREPEVVAAVLAKFGADVLSAEGEVDRSVLGARAFAEPGGIAFLEGLLHPRIGQWRSQWQTEARDRIPPPALLVCEVPLVYEAGLAADYDAVVVVTASEEVRRKRVTARGQDFDARSARQLPEEEKIARADGHVVNDGSLAQLSTWVDACMDRFAPGWRP